MKNTMNTNNVVIVALVIVVLLLLAYVATRPSSGAPQYTTVASSQTTVQSTNPTTVASTQTSTINSTHMTNVTTSNSSTSYAVKIATSASIGKYLVNATGYTLYLNSQDTSTTSTCYNQCAVYWHPFYVSNLTVQSNLTLSKFGTITRTGGAKQLTYDGYPLYQYVTDNVSGKISGNGVAGIWFAVTYPDLTT